jgi:hypothetical protein
MQYKIGSVVWTPNGVKSKIVQLSYITENVKTIWIAYRLANGECYYQDQLRKRKKDLGAALPCELDIKEVPEFLRKEMRALRDTKHFLTLAALSSDGKSWSFRIETGVKDYVYI